MRFPTTEWSLVLDAGRGGSEGAGSGASAALERLCRAYWPPVFAYLRRQMGNEDAARDVTQAFFLHVLEKGVIGRADQERGRFRSFLLVAARNFLSHEHEREATAKRGRGRVFDLDWEEAGALAAGGVPDAEAEYDRQWALRAAGRALSQLEDECRREGRGEDFIELAPFLTSERVGGGRREVAARLGRSEAAVTMALQRLRRRYGALLRGEVERTVAGPEAVEDELRYLIECLAR